MTADTFVGFREEPAGLEAFLVEQGYIVKERSQKGVATLFERQGTYWPCIFYSPCISPAEDEDEIPNWERNGFPIVSEVNINYPLDFETMGEAGRLSKELTKRFNGVLCETELEGAYFTAKDL